MRTPRDLSNGVSVAELILKYPTDKHTSITMKDPAMCKNLVGIYRTQDVLNTFNGCLAVLGHENFQYNFPTDFK
jgi:hypothetical protein